MNKVGLAVVTYKDNFGSALQTYATQRVIRNLGYDTGVFDISAIDRSIQKRKIMYYLSRILHKDERYYVLSNFLSSAKKKKNDDCYAQNMKIRHDKYQKFYKDNIEFLPKTDGWSGLAAQAGDCEAVVVGSDQLWGSANIAGGYFTLEFVPDDVNKIAYSTSFGVSTLPKIIHKHAKSFLNRIEHISVREVSGQKIIKELIDRDVPVVCDPTMLLTSNEWMDIQNKDPFTDGDYILTYFMGDNPEQREFVKRLKEETGYKIVGLLHGSTYIENDEHYCDETPYNVGPSEFLNLIRHAKFVCTDSFHCCVFSIVFGTEFFAFHREAEGSSFSTNDRLHTLLGWTGLSGRLLTGDENASKCATVKMDKDAVWKCVEENRARSMTYLENALKG